MIFHYSVTKQVRNSYDHLWDPAGFDLNRNIHYDVEILQYAECSTNTARINRNSRWFVTILEIFFHDRYKKAISMLRVNQFQNECSSYSSCSMSVENSNLCSEKKTTSFKSRDPLTWKNASSPLRKSPAKSN